jgi:hypothetical protein
MNGVAHTKMYVLCTPRLLFSAAHTIPRRHMLIDSHWRGYHMTHDIPKKVTKTAIINMAH